MKIHNSKTSLKATLLPFKKNKKSIGFVPTMGALHKGHLSLVKQALKENDCVVVSIFINPTQFDNQADLEKYPKTLENDLILLYSISKKIIVFSPIASELYNQNISSKSYIFSGIEKEMEGKHRAGHFDGVGTVLNLLFRVVTPNKAYFGEKDFQQLQIVKELVKIENLPINITGCPIVREKNGLAMSSRNKHLSEEEFEEAALIYLTLNKVKEKFHDLTFKNLNQLVENEFKKSDFFTLEYFEIANSSTLKTDENKLKNIRYRAFIACFIGGIRLIDNMALN
ncbi:MAG: pantoate--beta-alanine ligase [Flavobacteriales bacterium]|nr:MAG: pantoate--beta-alanine ligase [Flavobacteriales bacterium]